MDPMFYLYDVFRKKPLSYNPVTGDFKVVKSLSRLQIWDYQYAHNLSYLNQLVDIYNYMEVRQVPDKTLAMLLK